MVHGGGLPLHAGDREGCGLEGGAALDVLTDVFLSCAVGGGGGWVDELPGFLHVENLFHDAVDRCGGFRGLLLDRAAWGLRGDEVLCRSHGWQGGDQGEEERSHGVDVAVGLEQGKWRGITPWRGIGFAALLPVWTGSLGAP